MNLGVIYSRGELGEKDPAKAYPWAKLSLTRGNQKAKELVETLEKELAAEQIADADAFVKAFKPVPEAPPEEKEEISAEDIVDGKLEVIRAKLKAGANPDFMIYPKRKGFVLHVAVSKGTIESVKLILAGGAKPNPINWQGKTPLDRLHESNEKREPAERMAAEDFAAMEALLRKHGAKRSTELNEGEPATSTTNPAEPDLKLIARGRTLFQTKICFTCHQTDPAVPVPAGLVLKSPAFIGDFWGKEREVQINSDPQSFVFKDSGKTQRVKLDEAYFLESVEKPMAKIVKGAIPGMAPLPTTLEERKALAAYVKSLSK